MLVIATDKEEEHLLFYTPTKYGSDGSASLTTSPNLH
jgi:hypothetical protein